MLRNKIKCGYCGNPIGAKSGTATNGEKKRYYKCLGKKHHNGCTKTQVRKEVLEKYVIDNIVGFLSNKTNLDYMVDKLLECQEKASKENTTLNCLVRKVTHAENQIKNITTTIENGGATNTLVKRLKELEELAETLEKQIYIERAKSPYKLTREEFMQFYKLALEKESRTFVNYLVKEVELFNNKIIITYNNPNKSLDGSQDFCLFNSNVPYPIYIQNRKVPTMIDFRMIMKF